LDAILLINYSIDGSILPYKILFVLLFQSFQRTLLVRFLSIPFVV
jgi:hypothetical protein